MNPEKSPARAQRNPERTALKTLKRRGVYFGEQAFRDAGVEADGLSKVFSRHARANPCP